MFVSQLWSDQNDQSQCQTIHKCQHAVCYICHIFLEELSLPELLWSLWLFHIHLCHKYRGYCSLSTCKIWQKHGKFAWNEFFEEPGYTWHVCFTCPSQVGGPGCTHITFSSNCRQRCSRFLQFRFNPALPEAQASLTETLLLIVLWVNCHV